jgi:hypothetical protein
VSALGLKANSLAWASRMRQDDDHGSRCYSTIGGCKEDEPGTAGQDVDGKIRRQLGPCQVSLGLGLGIGV